MKYPFDRTTHNAALRIIAIYAIFAALWIYLSDEVLSMVIQDKETIVRISVFKGFLFIGVTSILLYQLIVRHIQKIREVEQHLQGSRNLVNAIVEGTPDIIFVKDRQGRYLLFNTAAEKLTGKSAAEVTGNDDTFLFRAEEARAIMAGDQQVMALGQVMTKKEGLTTTDGMLRTFLATKGPIFDARGEVSGLFGISRDITLSEEAEKALRESEMRYRSLFDHMMEGYAHCKMLFDESGRLVDFVYLDVNEAFERLTGLTGVVGKRVTQVLSGVRESSPELFEIYGRVASTGKPERFEINFEPLKSWLSISVYSPEREHIVMVFDNITERKRAQEALQEVSQRLSLATAAGHLGIWDWNIDNDVLVWNDRMFELYGVSQGAFLVSRETWEKCLHPDDLPMALEETMAALREDREYDYEFRCVHPDGTVKFIKTNAMIIRDEYGKAVRMIGMNQDITERKHLEEQLRHSQKMEAVGQLAGGVAHDFNNILTAIYGHCSMLQMKMGTDAPFRSDIDQIFEAAKRAANLTRSLLAFSRKQIMSPKKVNLNAIVSDVVKLLDRIIGEDIRLKTVLTENPLTIMADGGQIEQVLMNLAANARDAMPNGGILSIETGVQEIDESFILSYGFGAPGKYVVLSVSDTGKGMDAETCKKIFEPFFTTKDLGKGTGLGLAIVYGVIKQHNGYITVSSEPTRGTTFRIYLSQVYGEDADIEEEPAHYYPRMGTETILVAEDDEAIRELTGSILREFGYDVIFACDGEDAVDKFKAGMEKIAIIVMDMVMPKKSGKDAYEEIRKVRADVKIIFMSGYSPDLLLDRGIFDSNESVLIKPIYPLTLVRKVRDMLDSQPHNDNGDSQCTIQK
jgi:PAS domain S-box-containing protein